MENTTARYFESFKDSDGNFRFRLQMQPGAILLTSIPFPNSMEMWEVIHRLREISDKNPFSYFHDKEKGFYYQVHDGYNSVAKSIFYSSKSKRDVGIETTLLILELSRNNMPWIKLSSIFEGKNSIDSVIKIRIHPGSAPQIEIANLLAGISRLYRQFGGSGLTFTLEGIEESTQIETS